ncbi:hypothetical protein JXA32_04945 [Candidatus Sumerlaeota bacterium]|nr:hypothetical protein [Candidatus Sumerlaeota bacterium]
MTSIAKLTGMAVLLWGCISLSSAAQTFIAPMNTSTETQAPRSSDTLKVKFDRSSVAILKALDQQANLTELSGRERLQALLALGEWDALKADLRAMPRDEGGKIYLEILTALQQQTNRPAGEIQQQQLSKMAIFTLEDALKLTDCTPVALDAELIKQLAPLYTFALNNGQYVDALGERLEQGTEQLGGDDVSKRRMAADLLYAMNQPQLAAQFLPSLQEAQERKDFEALNKHLQSLNYAARENKDAGAAMRALELHQWLMRNADDDSSREQARMLSMLFTLRCLPDSDGAQWLAERFTDDPQLANRLLAALGAHTQQNLGVGDPEQRIENLKLIRLGVDALFAAQLEEEPHWRAQLDLFGWQWGLEAGVAMEQFASLNPNQLRMFYQNNNPRMQMQQQNMQASTGLLEALIDCAPDEKWLACMDAYLATELRIVFIKATLKSGAPSGALPQIERLAQAHPHLASDFANELLEEWVRGMNPASYLEQMNYAYNQPYGLYYSQGTVRGVQPANSIPLTRARQKRNLERLAAVLRRMEALPLQNLSDPAAIKAFAACHSDAEVFRIEDVENVLGPVDQLSDARVVALVQVMRERLAGAWRKPDVQEQQQTQRSVREMQQEVQRGYRTAVAVMENALPRHADEPAYLSQMGAVLFDSAEYDYSLNEKLAEYTSQRDRAFEFYRKAAECYGAKAASLQPHQYQIDPYFNWFVATLGASDLSYLTRGQEHSQQRLLDIRQAILDLGEASDKHFALFGELLDTLVPNCPSHVKFRFLAAGLAVLGDHPGGAKARSLLESYTELLSEIELHAEIDGAAEVGCERDFGVFISMYHTPEIAREGGGFAKYLMNSQSQQNYYNPGGVDYRDDFEENIRNALEESFDVRSVTFCDPSVQARASSRPGWHETPLAYLQLRARDAAVDRIPPMQIDLDFVDAEGQIVLPVESPIVPIDARSKTDTSRPMRELKITQILDEREINDGVLKLEVECEGRGLIPDFDALFDADFSSFASAETVGLVNSVARIEHKEDFFPICERNWIVNIQLPVAASNAMTFRFPEARIPDAVIERKRFSDADLVEAEPEVQLALRSAGGAYWPAIIVVLTISLLAGVIIGGRWILLRRRDAVETPAHAYRMPEQLTPFTVANLLHRIAGDSGLNFPSAQRDELAGEIVTIEQTYFGPDESDDAPELELVAHKWIAAVRKLQ